jgi:hypothetical protein
MSSRIDSWDEVWDAYEARQPEPEAARLAPRRQGRWRRVALPVLAAMLFLLGCAAGSAWPVLNLYALVLRQDTPALLRQVDLRGVQPGLLAALRQHAGLEGPATAPGRGTAAEALLAAMSEDMATALSQPGALAQLALAREGMDIVPLGGVAAPPLQAPMLAGRGALSLDLGVARGAGGFGLDLAWRQGGWHAVAVSLLDPPVTLGAEGVRAQRTQAALAAPARRAG